MWQYRHRLNAFPDQEQLHGLFHKSPFCCYFPGREFPAEEPLHYPDEKPWMAGCLSHEPDSTVQSLNDLRNKWRNHFLIGYLSYSLKNQLFGLSSSGAELLPSSDLLFFEPDWMIRYEQDGYYWLSNSHPQMPACKIDKLPSSIGTPNQLGDYTSYLQGFNRVINSIRQGDVYEVNYCQAWEGTLHHLDSFLLFVTLIRENQNPFAALFKARSLQILSLSPERFLAKSGNKLISQPIKGTRKRASDPEEDARLREELKHSFKDFSENVMIADLVRNDLSKYASRGSVKVQELAVVYAFPKVFQMLSTIQCCLREEDMGLEALLHAFPMGSMTGVPKVSAMKLIDETEAFSRGLFSGSLGYFDGSGNYDFNVLIRSLFLDSEQQKYFFASGGAITCRSEAHDEYEESLLKSSHLLHSLKAFSDDESA